MTTNKILSFEEFSAQGTTDAAVAEPTTTTTDANAEATTDAEVDAEETTDAEVDTEETTDTETEEETEDVEESDDAEHHEEPKTVEEMYEELKTCTENEAKAYEGDAYDEHTVESYLKEAAAMNAKMVTEVLANCRGTNESYTKEAYESSCNEMKEAYAKKIDEVVEAYESMHNEETTDEYPTEKEGAVIAEPAK